ncbi:MAG: AraC family transcriptional regulator [Pyrinomonadaceae bacterium]
MTETSHKPNCTLARHYHEHANIAFVLSGSFTEILDGRRFECALHSSIIKPAGEAHANQYGRAGMHCILIEAQAQRLESLHPWSKVFNRIDHVRGAMLPMLATRVYKEMCVSDSASMLAIEGLTFEIIAELSRQSSFTLERKPPRWLKRAQEILHAHLSESLSFTGVAETVDVHPVHLARAFRKFYGCTPGEYLRQLRIEFACRKLSASDTPLVEISLASGFSHQAHFSRVFKRYIGITPSEYRSLYRAR